jgi:hypothetical protein
MSEIKHWRVAGGAAQKMKDEPVLILPFKDVGAGVPGLDISAGLMQEGDSPRLIQLGEAAEEIVNVEPETLEDGELEIYIADVVEDTSVEERVREFYERTAEISDLPENYNLNFVDSARTGLDEDALDSTEQYGEKEFGAVHEPPVNEEDKWSRELIEYLEVDTPGGTAPLDLERVEGDDPFYLNRIDFEIDVETGETVVWREGEKQYEGDFEEALDYVENEVDERGYNTENIDEDQKNPYEDPFNVKSGAAVRGLPEIDPDESIAQFLEG